MFVCVHVCVCSHPKLRTVTLCLRLSFRLSASLHPPPHSCRLRRLALTTGQANHQGRQGVLRGGGG